MKLKRVRILAPVSLKGRVLGNSYETLAANAGYDREVHGEAIDVWPLLVHMLREFVSADRAFTRGGDRRVESLWGSGLVRRRDRDGVAEWVGTGPESSYCRIKNSSRCRSTPRLRGTKAVTRSTPGVQRSSYTTGSS